MLIYEREKLDPHLQQREYCGEFDRGDINFSSPVNHRDWLSIIFRDLASTVSLIDIWGTPQERNELIVIHQERLSLSELKGFAQKIRKAKQITYQLELSDKNPLDVRFGNESGCCIGIHENGEGIGNAYGLPHMIADNASYIFNVKQKIGQNGKYRRVGIVLAFETEDEDGNKVLACNSLELSPLMNPVNLVPEVVAYVEDELADFAKGNGYSAVFMSNHDYNTSKNYSTRSKEQEKICPLLRKLGRKAEPKFYSEIVNQDKTIRVDREGFYTIWQADTPENRRN